MAGHPVLGTDEAEKRADIDATRTATMGGSFGGYMANWIAGHTDRFPAIVSHAGLWALDQLFGTTDGPAFWRRAFGDFAVKPERYLANSPHLHADKIVTPILIIHGDKDYRVPVGEALRMWWDLSSRSKTVRFLYFPDENHWILKARRCRGLVPDHPGVPGRAPAGGSLAAARAPVLTGTRRGLPPSAGALTDLGVPVNCYAGAGSRSKTRMFYPSAAVPEDPATGSAAGPLAVHLARHGRISYGQQIQIRQGEEVGRPSVLHAKASGAGDRIDTVEVGGAAVIVAAGRYRTTLG